MPSGQLPRQFSQTAQLEDSVTKHGRWGPKTGGLKSDAKGTPVPCTPIVYDICVCLKMWYTPQWGQFHGEDFWTASHSSNRGILENPKIDPSEPPGNPPWQAWKSTNYKWRFSSLGKSSNYCWSEKKQAMCESQKVIRQFTFTTLRETDRWPQWVSWVLWWAHWAEDFFMIFGYSLPMAHWSQRFLARRGHAAGRQQAIQQLEAWAAWKCPVVRSKCSV